MRKGGVRAKDTERERERGIRGKARQFKLEINKEQ